MATQYDSNGYAIINPIKPMDISGVQQQSANTVNQALAGMDHSSQRLEGLQGMASQYPAMSNSYGLGSIPGTASNPSYNSQPLNTSMPDTGSRGFNPWSLTGEALSRGK